jgi:hypothetical protein
MIGTDCIDHEGPLINLFLHKTAHLGSERDYSGYDRFSVIGGQSALGTDIIGN